MYTEVDMSDSMDAIDENEEYELFTDQKNLNG